MNNTEINTRLIKWHKAIKNFDYNITVNWAIELLNQNIESENILILSSFTKPFESYEIRPYVTAALNDLKIEEIYSSYSLIAELHFHMQMILENYELRKHLFEIYNIYLNEKLINNDITPFYLIYYAWNDLETVGYNNYFEGATLLNIEQILKQQIHLWIDKNIEKLNNVF